MRLHTSMTPSRQFASAALIVALVVGAGASMFPNRPALAGAAQRRAAMLAMGIDTMPVGTAGQMIRFKQARLGRP